MRRLDAAARAEKARMDKQNEKNRNVSYRWWEMLPKITTLTRIFCKLIHRLDIGENSCYKSIRYEVSVSI